MKLYFTTDDSEYHTIFKTLEETSTKTLQDTVEGYFGKSVMYFYTTSTNRTIEYKYINNIKLKSPISFQGVLLEYIDKKNKALSVLISITTCDGTIYYGLITQNDLLSFYKQITTGAVKKLLINKFFEFVSKLKKESAWDW